MLDSNPFQVIFDPAVGPAGTMTIMSPDATVGEDFAIEIHDPSSGDRWQGPASFSDEQDGIAVANIPLDSLFPVEDQGPLNPGNLTIL